MKLSEFDYTLPKELIAQYPAEQRDQSRLLVLDRAKGAIFHQTFNDIVQYLSPGDCLVLNNTKVFAARMIGKREKASPHCGGGKQEIFFLERLAEKTYRVLAKPAKPLTKGALVLFNDGEYCATVTSDEGANKIIQFNGQWAKGSDIWPRLGQVPLPPYIKRAPEALDQERYQTVYAQEEGASAAPTAGLHFTPGTLRALEDKGVQLEYVTLHVNYGTFAPVQCEDIEQHIMHREYFVLPEKAAAAVKATRAKGKKVWAVGTTAVRVLETAAVRGAGADLSAEKGWTQIFIYPPYNFKVVDGLLTNFHFPKSTLLMLVSAFAGKELIFKAYQEAIGEKYRFFSYGDAMLII